MVRLEIPVKINYQAALILLQRVSSTERNSSLGLAAVYLADILLIEASEEVTLGNSAT